MDKPLLISFFVVIIILLFGIGYLLFQNQQLIKKISSSPSPAVLSSPTTATSVNSSPTPIPTSTPRLSPTTLQENIKDSINSKNFAALASYMTSPNIYITLQSTECCGPQTPEQAVAQFSYIREGIPFDFNQNSETVKNLQSKNPELANKYIGISKNKEHLIAFEINSENKIVGIRMSASWKLFTL